MRPADAVEAAECWEIAFEHRSGPSTLVFRAPGAAARAVNRRATENRSRRGAYVLAEAEGGPRQVTLLATGSEVVLALAARRQLAVLGASPTAVVSMPSWELFESQPADYRMRVCSAAGTVRVACEAAMRFGWDRYLGERGGFVGMTGFGASGSADTPLRALRHHGGSHRRRGETVCSVEEPRAVRRPLATVKPNR